ncbi:MAG: MFS transporter, partial [Actinomycetota bacterium]
MPETVNDSVQMRGAWLALAVTCLGVFLTALDQTAVSALLPDIIKHYEGAFSPTAVERAGWIVTAYLVGYTIVMPVMGRVADIFGERLIFNVSILIFIAGSVLCALSPGLKVLAFFRALQAVGGGAIVPIAMGMVGHSFSLKRQALAIGVLVAAGEAGGVIGPLYGALVARPFGWEWIFWINVPLGLAIMAAMWKLAPAQPRRRVPVDYRGAVLLAMFLTLLTAALSGQRTMGWYRFVIPMLAASVVVLAIFILVERGR